MGRNDKASVGGSRLMECQVIRSDSNNLNPGAIPANVLKNYLSSHTRGHGQTTTQGADLGYTPFNDDSIGLIQSCHHTCDPAPFAPAEQQKEKLRLTRPAGPAPLLKALNGSKLFQELPPGISKPSINSGTLLFANGLMSPISPGHRCTSCSKPPGARSPGLSVQDYEPPSPHSPPLSPEISPKPLTNTEQALDVINTEAYFTFPGNQVSIPSGIAQIDANSSKPVLDTFDTRNVYHRPEESRVDCQVLSIEALKLTRAWASEDLSELPDADSSNERNTPTEGRTANKYLLEPRLLARARTNGTRSSERQFDEVANSSEFTDYAEGEEVDQLCSNILGDFSILLGNNPLTQGAFVAGLAMYGKW